VHTLFLALILGSGLGGPHRILPAGTVLNVRLKTPVASYNAKTGEFVAATMIAPVTTGDRIVVPAGTQVIGHVGRVRKVGLGLLHERAILRLDFDRLIPAGGPAYDIRARVLDVDNARESVDGRGNVIGIVATQGFSRRTSQVMQGFTLFEPWVVFPLATIESVFLETPNPEIHFPAGTELSVVLESPVAVGLRPRPNPESWPDSGWTAADQSFVASLPYRTVAERMNRPSDIVNLLFLGSRAEIDAGFERAGWVASDPLSFHTGADTLVAIAHNRGFLEAPMSTQLLAGRPQDITFEKGLNTVSKRHHLRIWNEGGEWGGEQVWLSSSSRDVGIGFANRAFTHRIATDIDAERRKVVNDLSFAGCVAEVRLVARPEVPRTATNSTGDLIETDGRIAVVKLKTCTGHRELPAIAADMRHIHGSWAQRVVRRFLLTANNYVRRSNPVCTGIEIARALRRRDQRVHAKLPRGYAGQASRPASLE
jgi:LssY C-terminus